MGKVEIGGMEERKEVGREGKWVGESRKVCVRGRVVGWMW